MPAAPFSVSTERIDDGRVVVRLDGELDGATADTLSGAVATIPEHADVTLDVRNVGFVDSAGLRALALAHARFAGSGGSFRLDAPSSRLLRLLELTDLAEVLVGHDGR